MVGLGTLTPPRRLTVRTLFIFVAISLAALLFLAIVWAGLAAAILALGLLVGATYLAWRSPIKTAVFFAAFLPVNRFVILLIFHLTGSGALTKLTQLWKDGLIVLLLVRVIYDAAFNTKAKRVKYLDLLILFFIAFSFIYIFYPGPDDPMVRVQGFRSDAFFLVAYFVGRGLKLGRKHVRWLLAAIIPGSVAVAVVAALQFAMPSFSNFLLDGLGFKEFTMLQGGLGDIEPVRDRVLGGTNIPRASSLLLGDLALAFYEVLLVSLAAAMFFEAKTEKRRLLSGLFLLAMVGTLGLTITRSAILAMIPVVLLAGLISRSLPKVITVGVVCISLGLAALLVSGIQPRSLQQLFNPNESSTVAHENAFFRSLDIIKEEPLGRGLGTAGTIGQRFFSQSITNESWYLQLGTEMGVVSPLTYLTMTVVVAVTCFAAYRRLQDTSLRILALGVASTSVGFLVVANFLHAWENTALSMLIWLYAGIAVRAGDIDRSEAAAK